jgi:hypothetical protein
LMHWMSVKLPDNFQMREHSWPCRFHINLLILSSTFLRAEFSLIQSRCRSFIRVIVPYEISKANFRVETKIEGNNR